MWWSKDFTGRFTERPFYTHQEIEDKALSALHHLATEARIEITYPLHDDVLDLLVDFMTERFDISANTALYGVDVDGFTIFARNEKPSVVLNQDLAAPSYRLRRRFTIGHELGHVVLHQPLYERDDRQLDLLVKKENVPTYCMKQDIERSVDWCEWQAGFFGGTLLMPTCVLRDRLLERDAVFLEPSPVGSIKAQRATSMVADLFDVSRDAARVRLSHIGVIKSAFSQQLGEQTA